MRPDKTDACVADPAPDLRCVSESSIRRAQGRRKEVEVEAAPQPAVFDTIARLLKCGPVRAGDDANDADK